MSGKSTVTKPMLSVWDAVALIVGIVIGAGIFETPSLVAVNAGSPSIALLIWCVGGGVSLVGALCYAELATAYPHPGGSYYYFQRAFGNNIAFLFAWARLTVMQTGSIVLLGFVFGDYASQVFSLGDYSASIYAAIAIILFSGLNILGIQQSKWTQNWLAFAQVLGLLAVIVVGLVFTPPSSPTISPSPTSGTNLGLAMVFVLLTYGGWNEAAHISAELRDVRRNMSRSLLWSLGIITLLYLLINFAYFHGLGFSRIVNSQAVAADLMRATTGNWGVVSISLLVSIATLCSLNATVITGARTNYALGRDFRFFTWLGNWNRANTPINALLVQGAIALLLVLLGTLTRKGFETMVEYTSPVFWFFFLLTGISLIVLRMREPERDRPFKVPLYPFTPLLFCGISIYMLQSSLVYTGVGALVGVAVLLAGIPFLFQKV
ncbi:MAG: amino acid permease [Hydrococcus sp. Prado102]|jgi:amino acid transporter|nr:amino acid permease [Hydrococcus sp. Prado102]